MKTPKQKTKLLRLGPRSPDKKRLKQNSRNTRALAKTTTKRQARRQNYPIHKRFLLHPITLFGLLCIGVLIAGWTYQVVADTVISSVIEAPNLQAGATIISPTDGANFTSSPITVAGTCPDNSYIKLDVNGVLSGISWCNPDNTFLIETSLFSGANTLVVQDYNETDLAGPTTPSIRVSFTPTEPVTTPVKPQAPTSSQTTSPASSSGQSVLPLIMGSDFQFKTFAANKTFTWKLDLEGGTPPYVVHVMWGDRQTSVLHFATDPVFTLVHSYKSAGYYAVIVSANDNTGQQKIFQLAALITNSAGVLPNVANSSNHSPKQSLLASLDANVSKQKWLLVAWPAYLTVLLMAVSFWLGENREYSSLKTRR